MNAVNIRSGLVCALVAGLATSAAVAMDAAAVEKHRADRQERQEQRQAQRQERNARAPSTVAAPAAAPAGGQRNGAQRDGGSFRRGGSNDNRVVVGPPRGDGHGRGDARIVPPKDYNPPGNGHSPGQGHSPGYGRPPQYVSHLPSGHHRHYWNGRPYYYHGGHWYRPHGTRYVVVTAPYGLFVPYLPYYSSFWFGTSRYFYSDGVYYNYEPARRGYVVARSPYEEESTDAGDVTDEDLYIYPAQGQSPEQQADDKYECHSWAVEQTGYDPIDSDYDAERRSDYIRALTACLTGRGYTVR